MARRSRVISKQDEKELEDAKNSKDSKIRRAARKVWELVVRIENLLFEKRYLEKQIKDLRNGDLVQALKDLEKAKQETNDSSG